MKHEAHGVDDALVKQIAEQASADVRSVVRRLAGLPVRGLAGKRIDDVLARRGKGQREPSHAA